MRLLPKHVLPPLKPLPIFCWRAMFLKGLTVSVASIALLAAYRLTSNSSSPPKIRGGSGEMFDGIASFYDMGNSIISAGLHQSWKRDLLHLMNVNTSTMLLDLATGTGDVAILAGCDADFMAHKVVGVDPSNEMIKIAKNKIKSDDLSSSVSFQIGDAENLINFGDGGFDAVSMSFGIRNVQNRTAALEEIYRVLIPGGVCGILELTHPHDNILGQAAGLFTRYAVPLIGFLLGGSNDEYYYLQESVFNFPSNFENEMEIAGLKVTAIHEYLGGIIKIFIALKV